MFATGVVSRQPFTAKNVDAHRHRLKMAGIDAGP
jgi:hypothetical protein